MGIKKTACLYCNSKDNLIMWDNGSSQCMTPNCQYNDLKQTLRTKVMTINETIEKQELLEGIHSNLIDRKISLETCKAYGYETYINEQGVELHIANHRHKDTGEIVSQQIRYPNKSFPWINAKEDIELFGLHLCTDYTRPIYITEGQIDAMSIYEASGGMLQAASIPRGIRDAKNALLSNKVTLEKFSKTILFFDNDEAGQVGLKECRSVLPIGKGYIVNNFSVYKDANEILVSLDGRNTLWEICHNVSEIVPLGVIFGDQINFKVMQVAEPMGHPIPYGFLNENIRGIKKGRVYMIGAGTGIGKSSFLWS